MLMVRLPRSLIPSIPRLIPRVGSWTYNYATGNAVHGTAGAIGEDAEFLLASSTKLIATIAALQVVEKGLFGLDDDVAKHLPELTEQPVLKGFDENDKPILEERKNAITLRYEIRPRR